MTRDQVSDEMWEHARRALSRFFKTRNRGQRVDDLAQETLVRVFERVDYSFDTPTDFLRICYGFGRLIMMEEWRRNRRNSEVEFEKSGHEARSTASIETELYHRQLLAVIEKYLREDELRMLQNSFETDRKAHADELGLSGANAISVRLHRTIAKARKSFEKLGQTSL